jgi:hypothetical protein
VKKWDKKALCLLTGLNNYFPCSPIPLCDVFPNLSHLDLILLFGLDWIFLTLWMTISSSSRTLLHEVRTFFFWGMGVGWNFAEIYLNLKFWCVFIHHAVFWGSSSLEKTLHKMRVFLNFGNYTCRDAFNS